MDEPSSPLPALAAEAPPSPKPPALHPRRVPAFRMIVDLSTRKARLILAGGQSGSPENPHYDDQLAAWREGQYLDLELGELKEGEIAELIPG